MPQKRQTINLLVRDKTSYELANFLHACAGSPSLQAFQQVIKNNFFPDKTNIALGHMDQTHKNVQLTQPKKINGTRTYSTMSKTLHFLPKKCHMKILLGRSLIRLIEDINTYISCTIMILI